MCIYTHTYTCIYIYMHIHMNRSGLGLNACADIVMKCGRLLLLNTKPWPLLPHNRDQFKRPIPETNSRDQSKKPT